MPVLHLISSIVSRMKGELIVLYISKNEPPSDKKQEDPFLFLDNLKNQLSIKKLRTEVVYENHMDVGLEHYSREYKPDWLIVSFEKLGQLNKLYQSGHRDHRMKFITRVPLLVVPDYSYLSGQA